MWTLTALQYTQGHGVYKPPQFYLHPSSTRITLAAGIKPFIVLRSGGSCLQPSIPLIFASGSLFLPRDVRALKFRFSLLPYIAGANRTLGVTFGAATDTRFAVRDP